MSVKSKKSTEIAKKASEAAIDSRRPKSLEIASRGVKTGSDFAELMSGLMTDLIEGRITPAIGNATCNAGGKLLKVVEMQYRYGSTSNANGGKVLKLTQE
jgi:hypothetical protein